MPEMRAYQPSFTAGELAPALHARVDLAKYQTGLKTAKNCFIHPHGGASNRAGFKYIGEVKNSALETKLVSFEFSNEQTYVLEFGNLYMRVWKQGAAILAASIPYEIVTPFVTADLFGLVFTQEADVVFISHQNYAPRKLSRFADNNWTLTTPTFAPAIAAPAQVRARDEDFAHFTVTNVSTAAAAVVTTSVAHGYAIGNKVTFTETDANGADLIGVIHTISAVTATTFTIGAVRTSLAVVSAAVCNRVFVSAIAVYKYKVSAVSSLTSEESLPSATIGNTGNDLAIATQANLISWLAVAGADRYNIYKEDNGLYGFIGGTAALTFRDENITANLADAPQAGYNPFIGVGNYPRCSTFIDQRLAFGGTVNNPQAVFLSQSASYENFGYSRPRKASDGFEFRIRTRKIAEVRALLATRGLLMLTSSSEWVVSNGSDAGPLPNEIVSKNQGYRGGALVQPVVVGNTVLFAQALGAVIRDFSYEFAEDSFVGKDLTIMARHLFEYKMIRAWAYAQYPYSMIWVVLNDGSCATLTYLKEHDVWGWTRHTTDGVFDDVAVVAEDGEDVPYFIIKRTISGVSKRYVERLNSRSFTTITNAFFVDSGLTYTGAAATVISGLSHLNGKTVVALADGNVVRDLLVTAGVVTLPNAATVAHIGLPYEAVLKTLDLDLGQVKGMGSVQGRHKSIAEVTFRVEKTRGIWLGTEDSTRDSGKMIEYKQRATEAYNDAIGLYTGDLKITAMPNWTEGGNVVVKQFDPLPMTILAIMPDVTLGG